MTGMLASVTSAAEATLVLEAGADIIDLKNPAEGALGALPAERILEVVEFVDGRKPVSATVGDLPMVPAILQDAVMRTASLGVDFVKVGFFGEGGRQACIEALMPLAQEGISIVAVLFADQQFDPTLLPYLAEAGFYGAMIDTADKFQGGLRSWMDEAALRSFVVDAKRVGLLTGLAGSLRAADILPLLSIGPDYLGFRGALCGNDHRESTLDPARVSAISQAVAQMQHTEHNEPAETLHCNASRAYSSA
ncbi:uncharacterized protein NMK_3543 [Novimethylophilus kurashikiensis]|uniref:(5-formylfuran-3-yl)methyl phosphate synthase n=1 Tax=Novimethylophilus kurashikiensis TaxID=1825523 RepID=A0A2R5FD68_9PROT|nr:(5-formylfuran-3-yl)methyl phosphate synthase [Novimethylophilus kurashikiensis]GBG15925.1 uncharacterized protein NMK_3543 [Novimethylophilus kurashikiensis]